MTSAKRERAEAFLEALPTLSKAVGEGKSAELPLRGGPSTRPRANEPLECRVSPPPPPSCAPPPRPPDRHARHTPEPLDAEHYYCAHFGEFTDRLRAARGRLGRALERLGVPGAAAASADPDPTRTHAEEDDAMHAGVARLVDDHLDRVDRALDDIAAGRGDKKVSARDASVGGSVAVSSVATAAPATSPLDSRFAALAKPQEAFSPPPDNAPGPFFPPPPVRLSQERKAAFRSVPGSSPIADAVDALVYPAHATAVADDTALACDAASSSRPAPIFVDTEAGLRDVALDLRRDAVTAFAVDLEHHSHRTFRGFTCLVQISTRERDYVIDVLVPGVRARFRAELGGIFEDPGKTKILHGADYDVKWLQRDFGVYLVNMFDTGQAARALAFPKFSLAYLLKRFVNVEAEKQYQLADWRARPLSRAMLAYAAGDTKHLPYAYDVLKRRLRDASVEGRDLVMETYKRSEAICKVVYASPVYDATSSWRDEYFAKVPANERDLAPRQLAAFAAAHAWRDATARASDESPGYVATRALLLRIARALPSTERALLAITRGDAPVLAQNAAVFLDVTRRAAASGAPPAANRETAETAETAKTAEGPVSKREDATAGGAVGGGSAVVSKDADGISGRVPPSERPRAPSEVPPASAARARPSAMAAMLGDAESSFSAGAFSSRRGAKNETVLASAESSAKGSAMARALASSSAERTNEAGSERGNARPDPSEEDASAAKAAARVRESMAEKPVPLAEVFGFSSARRVSSGFAEKDAPVATGRHARSEKHRTDETVSLTGDDTRRMDARGPTPPSRLPDRATLPGGLGGAPAPLRRDPRAAERREAAAAAEAEAATKARAAAARDELARRRGGFTKRVSNSFGEASDSEASDEDEARAGFSSRDANGVDPEDEAALRAVGGGADGFDFAAAAAAALPGGSSFAALGAKRAAGRRGGRPGAKGGVSEPQSSQSPPPGVNSSKKRQKSGKYDANGRMIMVEPFKPGKKSKAFPRSGERNVTFS